MRSKIITALIFFLFIFTTDCYKQVSLEDSKKENQQRTNKIKNLRIISIEPSVTEILFFLEMDENIVAISNYCNRPAEKIKNIKRVGSIVNPSLAEILKLQADYIIANKDRNLNRTIAELESLNTAEIVLLKIDSFNSLFQEMQSLAELFSLPQRIKKKIEKLKIDSQALLARMKHYKNKKVYIDFSPDKPPFYSMANGSFLYTLLRKAGATMLTSRKPYPAYWLESIMKFNPDLIIAPVYYFKIKKQNIKYRQEIVNFWNTFFPDKNRKKIVFINAAFADSPGPSILKVLRELK